MSLLLYVTFGFDILSDDYKIYKILYGRKNILRLLPSKTSTKQWNIYSKSQIPMIFFLITNYVLLNSI